MKYGKAEKGTKSIRHEDKCMLLIIALGRDAIRVKMTGYDLGHPRKMFKSNIKY